VVINPLPSIVSWIYPFQYLKITQDPSIPEQPQFHLRVALKSLLQKRNLIKTEDISERSERKKTKITKRMRIYRFPPLL